MNELDWPAQQSTRGGWEFPDSKRCFHFLVPEDYSADLAEMTLMRGETAAIEGKGQGRWRTYRHSHPREACVIDSIGTSMHGAASERAAVGHLMLRGSVLTGA